MNAALPPIVKLAAVAASTLAYDNRVLSAVNDQVVRLSVMTRPYHWHRHPNSDETFIVLEGGLAIELEHGELRLAPGEMATIPRGRLHRTRPLGDRSVNLTVEAADTVTLDQPAA